MGPDMLGEAHGALYQVQSEEVMHNDPAQRFSQIANAFAWETSDIQASRLACIG